MPSQWEVVLRLLLAGALGAVIGFLGAGAILHRHGGVEGLTIAATIWASAGIGLAAGAGLYISSVSYCYSVDSPYASA